jgi:hypothetical protein
MKVRASGGVWVWAGLVLAAAGCTQPAPPSSQGVEAGVVEAAPPPPVRGEGTVRRIGSAAEVPLTGPRVEAKAGDWMLQGPGGVAVVSTTRGAIIDFGAIGGADALVSFTPTVFVGLDDMASVVESVEAAGPGGYAVLIRRRVLSDPALRLWTYVSLADGGLRIESVATAQDEAALAITVGEIVAWGNVPTWVEGYGFVRDKAMLSGDFLAREGLGVAYALENEDGHITSRFGKPEAGFHELPHDGDRVEGVPAHGASARRVLTMTQASGRLGAAVALLPRVAKTASRVALPAGVLDGTLAEIARCAGMEAPPQLYARFDAHAKDVALPSAPGDCFRGRLVAPGFAAGAWTPVAQLASAPLPTSGTLRWHVREKAAGGIASVVPARLVVRGIGGTPDPWWGEDPVDGAALDVLHVDRDGEIPAPAGRYHVMVTRGFEYTMHEADVTVTAGKPTDVEATLERVVDTRGWISADLHVHAVTSPDAPTPLVERVRSLAAAGVEVAVATDHNGVTDYGPAIHERGLDPWLTSIVGDEVTTRPVQLGHFNVFPLAPGSAPVAFEHITPQAIMSAARAAPSAPDGGAGEKIVQLNHPMMGSIGYLELLHFDPRDVAGWRRREPLAEMGFDAIEVFNGDHYAAIPEVQKVMGDWYALLDAGVHATATGNSDSHRVTYHECGVPRNYVQMADDDPAHLDGTAFVEAIRAGHVVVSSGVLVRVDIGGHGPGETVPAGDVKVHVTADAPPWVDVTRVELVSHGKVLHTWTGPFAHGVRRLDASFATTLATGDWVIATASGEQEMKFLARAGAKPFGFTNPVWVK